MSVRLSISAVLCFVVVSPSAVTAQEELRWKLRGQENLKYNVQQIMKTSMTIGGSAVNQTMHQTMDMSWQVQGVSAGGDAAMSQTVDRIQMKMEGGPAGSVQFDTNNNSKSESPIVNAMGDVFRKIVNQPFQVTMKPSGEITNVEVPDQLLEAVRQSSAGTTGALDENTLKQMMKQSAVTLPTEPVSPGSAWTSLQTVELPFGTMNIRSAMKFREKDSAGNAVIDVTPEITVTPKEGAPVKMTLKNSTGKGTVTFSAAQGRVLRSQLELTLNMTVDAAGQSFNQTIEQTTVMTLAQ
ncbi:MAG: hypothetical protein KDA89_19900 [Planctomycetaceae bacterium]|nr:hypothetical protein [Planctomycetaceae bacterium]